MEFMLSCMITLDGFYNWSSLRDLDMQADVYQCHVQFLLGYHKTESQ